jgi:hypothetical protein
MPICRTVSRRSRALGEGRYVKELLQQQVLVFPPEWVGGREEGEFVRHLPQLAAELVVFLVVVPVLDSVAVYDFLFAVGIVRRPCYEVDLAQEALQGVSSSSQSWANGVS